MHETRHERVAWRSSGGEGNRTAVSAAEATLKFSINDAFKAAVSIGRLTPYGLARAP